MPQSPNLLKDVQKLELDPAKRYILFLPTASIPPERVRRVSDEFSRALVELGIHGIVVAIDHPENVRIVEAPAP